MLRLALAATLLAAPACAQSQKPDPEADARARRGDSLLVRPGEATEPPEATVDRPDGAPRTDTTVVRVGDTAVAVVTHTLHGPDGRNGAFWAVNLHDDESTSVDAALAVAAETGGVVVELVHSGARNLAFGLHASRYGVDPNRMFTPEGLGRSLGALSLGWDAGTRDRPQAARQSQATRAVEALADHVLTQTGLQDAAVVVTLHNNTPDSYSAASYLAGAEYATDAAAVTVVPGSDADDFFFVTDRRLYDALVARGFNAVLQDNARATDDGSLSVWAARNARPYVNVEAQHGHVAEQTRMMEALVEVLRDEPAARD